MAALCYDLFSTALGWVAVVASPSGVRRLALRPSSEWALEEIKPYIRGMTQDIKALADVRQRLETYFGDNGPGYEGLEEVPLDLEGAPPFFDAAWRACRRIPLGETRSYGWLAQEAGSPRAVRAAGQAMARNPVPILIPCHRVIGCDGGLRGYGGGLDLKARLLELERARHS